MNERRIIQDLGGNKSVSHVSLDAFGHGEHRYYLSRPGYMEFHRPKKDLRRSAHNSNNTFRE